MSLRSFRSPMVALMLGILLSILCLAAARALADDVGDGDYPDPTGSGLWSHADPPARASCVVSIIWFDSTCTLVVVV